MMPSVVPVSLVGTLLTSVILTKATQKRLNAAVRGSAEKWHFGLVL